MQANWKIPQKLTPEAVGGKCGFCKLAQPPLLFCGCAASIGVACSFKQLA